MKSLRLSRTNGRRTAPCAFGALLCAFAVMLNGTDSPAAESEAKQYARLVQAPTEVVEGESFSATVAYDLQDNEDYLHFESKRRDGAHVRSCCAMVKIKGSGKHVFELTAPGFSEARQLQFYVWTGTDWRTPRTPILVSEVVPVLSKEQADRVRALRAKWKEEAKPVLAQIVQLDASRGIAALLRDDLPGSDPLLSTALQKGLEGLGIQVVTLRANHLANADVLSPRHFDLLIIAGSRCFPTDAASAFRAYLRSGGKVLLLGGPPLSEPVSRFGGEWTTAAEYEKRLSEVKPSRMIVDFERSTAADWKRGGDLPVPVSMWEIAARQGIDGSRCFHAVVPKLPSWETYVTEFDAPPFRQGETLTCFWAKGNEKTRYLLVEWEERDGSRWIATVLLEDRWKHYVLPPEQFHFWESNPERGWPGDKLNPREAKRLNVGLARSHASYPGDGPLEFWIDSIGAAPHPGDGEHPTLEGCMSPFDMIYPSYKFFPVTNAAALVTAPCLNGLVHEQKWNAPKIVYSVQPRPQGTGCLKGRHTRFIPLIEARTPDGRWCGIPAAMIVHGAGRYKGGIWSSFCIPDEDFYSQPEVLELVLWTASRIIDGLFLYEGGTEFYTYMPDQKVLQAASTVALGKKGARGAAIGMEFRRKESKPGSGDTKALRLSETSTVERRLPPLGSGSGDWVSVVSLSRDGRLIDRLAHDVLLWEPRPAGKRRFVTVKDGEFMRGGQRFYPFGGNYMPSSGIGTEDGHYFEYWIDKRPYDPEIIQRDIDNQKRMGANAASIFCYAWSADAQNLVDILERFDRAGMVADLSIRPGIPMAFEWEHWKHILERCRIADNDAVMALDIAWEPNWGNYDRRKQYAEQWRKWIEERYGSIDNAERDWGYVVPRNPDGSITVPRQEGVTYDDPDKRRMVLAYRRFHIDMLCAANDRARRLIRSVDPNHLVSFRMADAGNPTHRTTWAMLYEFRGSAPVLDFLSPEAYGRIGDWQKVRPGMFEVAFCRMIAPGKPVMWKEMGCSVWEMKRMSQDPAKLEFAGRYYRDFMKMMLESHSNAYFYWWFPGGFRVGENSDFGVLSPDTSLRGASRVLVKNAARFKDRLTVPKPDYWIEVDPGATCDGVAGVYDRHGKEYWEARRNGHFVGLRTEATGTDSTNCPLVAVGGGEYNGSNPPKYLNALIGVVEVKGKDGRWMPVEPGQTVSVRGSKPLLRAAVVNMTEPKWVAPGKGQPLPGAVFLSARKGDVTGFRIPLPADVPYMGETRIPEFCPVDAPLRKPVVLCLEMTALHRAWFGNTYRIRLVPE